VRATRQFCTYFDVRYLARGLALLDSLRAHVGSFRLFVLCLDEETERALAGRPGVVALRLADLERAQPALLEARANRSWLEYYYTCTPAFIAWLFSLFPDLDLLSYLDADLWFFSSPEPLFDEMGDASLMVVEHRFPEALRHLTAYGRFNVGWLSFRRDDEALGCLERWRVQCLDWCYDRVEPTRFGDQKYLDAWPQLYSRLAILRHPGASLAPWNLARFAIEARDGRVLVDGAPLVFHHFHGLSYTRPGPFRSGLEPYGARLTPVLRRHVYRPYLRNVLAHEAALGGSIRANRKP
jgi:hypothetical protein